MWVLAIKAFEIIVDGYSNLATYNKRIVDLIWDFTKQLPC